MVLRIEDVSFLWLRSIEQIWALEVPVLEMEAKHLVWMLDVRFGEITPRMFMEDTRLNLAETFRTGRADLKHPIDITWIKGRWFILDGFHRLIKSQWLGLSVVKVRKIPRELLR